MPIFLVDRNGKVVNIDGQTLSIAAVAATARYQASVQLDSSPHIQERLRKSRAVIARKISSGASVYGLSTGFGGSGELPGFCTKAHLILHLADTRTDRPLLLGHALLQHQHIGVLPTSTEPLRVLPLQDVSSTSMPEAWVR